MAGRALLAASTLAAIGVLALPTVASAHSNGSYADCSGVHGVALNYNSEYIHRMTILLDGNVVYEAQFTYNHHSASVPVPQDGQAHSWAVAVESTEPGWDRMASGGVGPCGEPPTTTEPAPTTTEPAPTTTEPAPTTTEPAPTTTDPAPTTTDPAPTTTDPAPTTTDPAPTTTDPAPTTEPTISVSGSGPGNPAPASTLAPLLGQLPETGATSAPIALIGATFVAAGAFTLLAARRRAAN
jgi:LPXTG-motif cell wall-anchored protein